MVKLSAENSKTMQMLERVLQQEAEWLCHFGDKPLQISPSEMHILLEYVPCRPNTATPFFKLLLSVSM